MFRQPRILRQRAGPIRKYTSTLPFLPRGGGGMSRLQDCKITRNWLICRRKKRKRSCGKKKTGRITVSELEEVLYHIDFQLFYSDIVLPPQIGVDFQNLLQPT